METGEYLYISESVEKNFKFTVNEAMAINFNEMNSDPTYIDAIKKIEIQANKFFAGDEKYQSKTT